VVSALKLRYPSSSDVADAVRLVLYFKPLMDPSSLVGLVKEELRRRGFYAGLVNTRRVWRVYLDLVRRGLLPDLLDVVERGPDGKVKV
jgi:hypothetical protein